MNLILRQYKEQNGTANFPALFSIPKKDRIEALAKDDFRRTSMLVIAALTMALENINLKRGLNEFQVLDLAEAIIDSAGEDNLSFEDLMLFLQFLVRGKYEMSYESMDIPKFMKLLDQYRDERWKEGIKIRDEKIAQYQSLGPSVRSAHKDELADKFNNIAGKMYDLKASLRDANHENNILRQIDKK